MKNLKIIKKILIFGSGYVGGSLGILLAKEYEVVLIDINPDKIKKINCREAFIEEPLMGELLKNKALTLSADNSFVSHIKNTDLIILALPTDYNEASNSFDTSILESVLTNLSDHLSEANIVIKSTIPIGFTQRVSKTFKKFNIFFVPEFLREGNAIEDNLKPSRIIIGGTGTIAEQLANIFISIAQNNPKVFYMTPTEAEAVKLFSNAYLATRVSFFNELDTYALEHFLNSKKIIDGVVSDPRIGDGYHNPSFGYGGYCLPKDIKQLISNFRPIPEAIFTAVNTSNRIRKEIIAGKILNKNFKVVGIYRLIMKKGSDNFRNSAMLDIIQILLDAGKELLIFEPKGIEKIFDLNITHDLEYFKNICDVVLANRIDDQLIDIQDKVFTRDIYGEN